MVNHQRSGRTLELVDTNIIFYHSMEKFDLRYVKFLADGDSKDFAAVKGIYKEVKVERTRIY